MAFVRWNQNTQIWEVAVNPETPGTLFNHLPVANPTLPLDIANKQYVDAAAGAGFVPYNGANQTVNLNSQALIAGPVTFTGSNHYLKGYTYIQTPAGGAQDSSLFLANLYDGTNFRFLNYLSTLKIWREDGYELFRLTRGGDSWVANNITCGGGLVPTSYVYPGRADTPASQTSWWLASHGSFGLYTNTGLYVVGPVWAIGGMDPNYLTRESAPTDFSIDGIGSFTVNVLHGASYMRHNGYLFLTWMADCSFPGAYTYLHFVLPGGFVAQRYANSMIWINCGGQIIYCRIEVSPGSSTLYVYSEGGNFHSTGRFSGNLAIYVG